MNINNKNESQIPKPQEKNNTNENSNCKENVNVKETKNSSLNNEDKRSKLEQKEKIGKIQFKIDQKYLQIYKDNQLLDENNTVSSYHITKSDILTIKSSRQGEFLIFFSYDDKKVGKYVANEDKIFEAFGSIIEFFQEDYELTVELIFQSYSINSKKTVGQLNMKEFDTVLVQKVQLVESSRKG